MPVALLSTLALKGVLEKLKPAGCEIKFDATQAILASLKQVLGDLDRVRRWLRAVGYVQSAPGFHDSAKVVNGFSDLIVEVWGDAGRHARSAPGQGRSPLNVPIIVDAFVAVAE